MKILLAFLIFISVLVTAQKSNSDVKIHKTEEISKIPYILNLEEDNSAESFDIMPVAKPKDSLSYLRSLHDPEKDSLKYKILNARIRNNTTKDKK